MKQALSRLTLAIRRFSNCEGQSCLENVFLGLSMTIPTGHHKYEGEFVDFGNSQPHFGTFTPKTIPKSMDVHQMPKDIDIVPSLKGRPIILFVVYTIQEKGFDRIMQQGIQRCTGRIQIGSITSKLSDIKTMATGTHFVQGVSPSILL